MSLIVLFFFRQKPAYEVLRMLVGSEMCIRDSLSNLTIHTLEDVNGPWVGLKAWPGLWKWALLLAAGWFGASAAWELVVRR